MQKGFFASLFDLSFTSFVTTRLIKVLYVLSLVLLAIGYIAVAVLLFTSGSEEITLTDDGSFQTESDGNAVLGLLWLFVIGPLALFFYTLVYRVWFELVIVLFRIFENTRDQLAVTRAALNAGPGANGPQAAEQAGASHGG